MAEKVEARLSRSQKGDFRPAQQLIEGSVLSEGVLEKGALSWATSRTRPLSSSPPVWMMALRTALSRTSGRLEVKTPAGRRW